MINANSKFSQTDQRQFIDEIYFVNKKKEFNGTFVDSLKASITLKDLEMALQDKRKAYNYLVANTFKKYNICPDDLYKHLDSKWSETTINEYAEWYISKSAFDHIPILSDPYLPSSPLGIIRLVTYQYAVRTKWEGYKTAVLLYAENYSSKI